MWMRRVVPLTCRGTCLCRALKLVFNFLDLKIVFLLIENSISTKQCFKVELELYFYSKIRIKIRIELQGKFRRLNRES